MRPRTATRILCGLGPRLLALVALLVAAPAFALDPTNLRLDCVAPINTGYATTPTNCDTLGVAFAWDAPGQTSYQIQVDRDGTFTSSGGCPWNWDSGEVATGTTTATIGTSPTDGTCRGNPSAPMQALWRGLRRFSFRVRVKNGGAFGNWVTSYFSFETYPSMPGGLAVATGSGGGAKESYGDTSTHATYYVSPSGSNVATCGAVGSPCQTITYALNTRTPATAAGDVFVLRTGTYNESVSISGTLAAGTKSKPITIKRFSGETPTVTGAVTLGKAYWVIDGLTFTNASSNSVAYGAPNLLVKNSTFLGSGTSNNSDPAVVHIGGNESNYFVNNTMVATGAPYAVVEHHSGADLVIRGNDITSNGPRGINKTGGQGSQGNLTIVDNHVHGITGANGVGFASYYGTGEMYIARNRMYDISGGIAFEWLRGGWATFRNNTIGRNGGTSIFCYKPDDVDGQTVIENDSCVSTSIVFDISAGAWQTAHKIQWRNSNYYRNNGGVVTVADPADNCGSTGANCIDRTNVTNLDPSLDANGRPQAASTALINLGMASTPVPADGTGDTGTRVDIGRFEYQAAAIPQTGSYDYAPNPAWDVNATPRISWTFVDGDNTINAAGQTQSAYEAQIDTVNTFDSQGDWKPLCSSGKVTSSSTFWDVPASCSLVSGTKYYFRVRTWDNVSTGSTGVGLWSDYPNAFTCNGGSTLSNPSNVTNVRRADAH